MYYLDVHLVKSPVASCWSLKFSSPPLGVVPEVSSTQKVCYTQEFISLTPGLLLYIYISLTSVAIFKTIKYIIKKD